MSANDSQSPIIVFDGICVLCSGWVRFLLRHDQEKGYRFAAMQTDRGRGLLMRHGLDPDDPVSFVLVEGDDAWRDTDAIVRVVTSLGGVWRLARMLRLIPRPVRDAAYRWLARNRYRWFGRHDACVLAPAGYEDRFLH